MTRRRILVTGSTGHLGEALVRTLRARGDDVVSIDIEPSPFTSTVASVADRQVVREIMKGVNAVIHAASLHKPHMATHSRQDFVDVNVTGTLNLLEEAVANNVLTFLYTSTTSVYGNALHPAAGDPAAWITEDVVPIPKNIYGVTKRTAEDLCEIFDRKNGLRCLVLRTSRFFPEEDDRKRIREDYEDENVKANEFLYRRVELEDVVDAHLAALDKAAHLDFERYVISATTPFTLDDLADLGIDAPRVVKRRFPKYEDEYRRRGWRMFPAFDRVYVNAKARTDLGWTPRFDFAHVLERLAEGKEARSALARTVGSKGYHKQEFDQSPYPVDTG